MWLVMSSAHCCKVPGDLQQPEEEACSHRQPALHESVLRERRQKRHRCACGSLTSQRIRHLQCKSQSSSLLLPEHRTDLAGSRVLLLQHISWKETHVEVAHLCPQECCIPSAAAPLVAHCCASA